MSFIHTIKGGFDTDLSMKKCIPKLKVLKEGALLDKIFSGDLFLEKVMGINHNKKAQLSKKVMFKEYVKLTSDMNYATYKTKEDKLNDMGKSLWMEAMLVL